MKKIIALSAILSMSAAFAGDDVYGTFVLNSSEEQVILCVPWVNPGSEDGEIKVKDLIQTSTLVTGDQLFYYKNGGYKAWTVDNGAWVGVDVVKQDGGVDASAGAEEPLTRGNAVILKRPGASTRGNKDIIINGQVGENPAGAITMVRGGTDEKGKNLTPAYTLIAPASPDAPTSLNAGIWTGVKDNDCIIVNLKPYYYNADDSKWGVRGAKKDENGKLVRSWEYPEVSIPAGCGAWFVANGPSEKGTNWDPEATK